jgi:hypothetical protein
VEPNLINLPLQFTAEANLGQVYLHEIAIANWQTTAKIDGGKIVLDPCRLTLNGAPMGSVVKVFAPHRMMKRLFAICSGSAPASVPSVAAIPSLAVSPQMLRMSRVAPIRAKNLRAIIPF